MVASTISLSNESNDSGSSLSPAQSEQSVTTPDWQTTDDEHESDEDGTDSSLTTDSEISALTALSLNPPSFEDGVSLLSMPFPVLSTIVSYLSLVDLSRLRSTCRAARELVPYKMLTSRILSPARARILFPEVSLETTERVNSLERVQLAWSRMLQLAPPLAIRFVDFGGIDTLGNDFLQEIFKVVAWWESVANVRLTVVEEPLECVRTISTKGCIVLCSSWPVLGRLFPNVDRVVLSTNLSQERDDYTEQLTKEGRKKAERVKGSEHEGLLLSLIVTFPRLKNAELKE